MGRSEQSNLNQNADTARGLSASYGQQAQPIYNTLAPALTAEATNPQGMGQDALNKLRTSNMQSAGGSTGALIGQGTLEAARTRNVGGNSAALDEAARQGGRNLSASNLDTDLTNEKLKQVQQQSGLSGLQSMYGSLTADQLKALGISSDSYAQASQAYQNPAMGLLNTAMAGAAQYASAKKG